MPKKVKVMTRKSASSMFTTIGLCLLIYCLVVLFIPTLLNILLKAKDYDITKNKTLYCLLSQGITIVGTIISFGFMRIALGVNSNEYLKHPSIPSKEYFVDFLSFFSFTSLALFFTYQITNGLGVKISLINNIGPIVDELGFNNIIFAIIYILISPILEEIAFRGIMLKSLSRFGKKFALIVMAFVYGLAHGSFFEMIPAFVMAIILGKLELYSGTIRPCIIIHIIFKAIMYGLCLVPEGFVLYEVIFLSIIYLSTLILIITNNKTFIKISSNQNYKLVLSIFFKNPIAVLSLLSFILHSVLLIILR